jgi:hypothetical protein
MNSKGENMSHLLVRISFTILASLAFSNAYAVTPVKKHFKANTVFNAKTKEVTVGIADSYVPNNFDASSDVYVVVSGLFNNGCYHWKRADVTLNIEPQVHQVKAIADVSEGMCPMVIIPFTHEVKLGKLGAGTHTIRFMSGDGTYSEKTLTLQ